MTDSLPDHRREATPPESHVAPTDTVKALHAMPPDGAVPPMQPSAGVAEGSPSTWPTVIGIIAIVLASLSIVSTLWTLLAPVFLRDIMGDTLDAQFTWQSLPGAWRVGMLMSIVLSLVMALLLLAGGVSLLRRKTIAAILFKVWAIGMIIMTIVATSMQYALQDEFLNQIAAQSQGMPGDRTLMASSYMIGLTCGFVFSLAGPVFVLLWFRRPVIKSEVATWS